MKTAQCRSCGKEIVWTETEKGKRMPVDVEPSHLGTFSLVPDGEVIRAFWAKPGTDSDLRVSHFVTCPDADKFRRKAPGAPRGKP